MATPVALDATVVRHDLSNDKARYNKSNTGYDLDKEWGGYDNADSCNGAEYLYNVGQYNADDEHDAANDGAKSMTTSTPTMHTTMTMKSFGGVDIFKMATLEMQ